MKSTHPQSWKRPQPIDLFSVTPDRYNIRRIYADTFYVLPNRLLEYPPSIYEQAPSRSMLLPPETMVVEGVPYTVRSVWVRSEEYRDAQNGCRSASFSTISGPTEIELATGTSVIYFLEDAA